MSSFTIREAGRKDVAAIAALWREMMDYHREYDPRFRFASSADREIERHLKATIRSGESRIFVATDEVSVVGYVLGEIHDRKPIYPVGRYGFISDIAVTFAWRRRGVGRALVQALLQWFQARGVTAVELFVAEANPVSTAFWRSLGFGSYLRLLRRELEQGGP